MTMTQQHPGTVAALQYAQRPALDFTDIVEDFDTAFQDGTFSQRCLTWDCEDVAIFDREMVRVALGWMAPETTDQPWYLIVAVGAAPDADGTPLTRDFCEELAAHILERTAEYLPYDAVLRSEADGAIDADLIDTIADRIQGATPRPDSTPEPWEGRSTDASEPEPSGHADETATGFSRLQDALAGSATSAWLSTLKSRFTGPGAKEDAGADSASAAPELHVPGMSGMPSAGEADAMRELREAFCGTAPDNGISQPMHLSIYALGATMLLQAPPVGAALLVYTVLREDLQEAA
ncbi:hypothetical protein DQW77_17155 [Roseovarius sp. TE539]|uniref:hypothetical protein n=1 Tax=Roseovarius sp. TE539 TaxID=2249812 RepID=UPI000DDD1DD1|nr:hypothetical protein [Roseovarius sp. TE539]RBI67886.1 hypothetical protein DQW77_17155 [Roseovarius sp. TE539]